MSTYAFCFPGQGSQKVGMFTQYDRHPEVDQALAEASEALSEDLAQLSQDEQAINDTANTQPLLLAAGVGVYRAWLAAGGAVPKLVAGHSLGEFAALVAAGSIEFSDAVRLVRLRALSMQKAVPAGEGAMYAVLGLDREAVQEVCEQQKGQAWAVNFNAPGQVVLAGLKDDVAQVAQQCKQAGAKRAMPLPVSVPSHCPLMRPAADDLAEALEDIEVKDATIPVVQNASCQATSTAAELQANLVKQLVCPVDWGACVNLLASADLVVECGPSKVLYGLNRRIIGDDDKCGALSDDAAIDAVLA